jgi:hypothetical protein
LAELGKTGAKKIRLLACTIIVEVPDNTSEVEQLMMLDIIERNNLEGQALEALAWHLKDKKVLHKATARLER